MTFTPDLSVLPFTGWESDRFVRFAGKLRAHGVIPRARIIGREPITNTSVDFEGDVVDALWEGYRRIIVVKTDDGVTYQVGGTNATRPIASETVLFLNVPEEDIGQHISDQQIDDLLVMLEQQSPQAEMIVESLKNNIRLGNLSEESRGKVARVLTQFLTADDAGLRREIVEVLGVIQTPEVLDPLVALLSDPVPEVRIEVALRFRGLEPVIKSLGEESEQGTKCIDALVDALKDPIDEVRIYAAEDLGYFYNDKAIEALIESMKFDDNDHVRWAAVVALGRANKLNVAHYIVDTLASDEAISVQQGAMMGLGRIGARVIGSQPHLADRLISVLCEKASAGPSSVRDYAAYTLGELEKGGTKCIETLVEFLQPDVAFEIKSNSALSLMKLVAYFHENAELTGRIEQLLGSNLELPRPNGWPSSAFYNWFLTGAAELAALLEFYYLAYRYYNRASDAFRRMQWLSRYYEGISKYELGEHLCNSDDLTGASASLDEAIAALEQVEQFEEFQRQSDQHRSGLQFKVTLARARRSMIEAAIRWSVVALQRQDYREIQVCFEQAVEQYRRIDVIGLSEQAKKLSREEVNLVLCLRQFAEVGRELMELKFLSIDLAEQKLTLALGNVRSNIHALVRLAEKTRSLSLRRTAANLADLVKGTYASPQVYPVTEVVGELLDGAKPIFAGALPTPGTCPVIDFGSAMMNVELRDSIAGDGSQVHPFLFPSDRRLVWEFTVSVIKRTKNDQLIVRGEDPPPGARDTVQEVPVHESSYSVRPMDYGELAPSSVPTRYRFILEFRNQGCSQPVQIMDIWVRVYDVAREFTHPKDKQREQLNSLRSEIGLLTKNLEHLQKAAERFKPSPPMELRQQIRSAEARLNIKKSELAKLEEDMRNWGEA